MTKSSRAGSTRAPAPTAAPLPFALRASAALSIGALLWTIVFFSHLPVVVDAAVKGVSSILPWPFSNLSHWFGTGCQFVLDKARTYQAFTPESLSGTTEDAWLPNVCRLDFAFWPSGFETPKAWVLAGAGMSAGIFAVIGGALRFSFPPDKGGQGGLGRPKGGLETQNPLNPPCQGEGTTAPLSHAERWFLLGILATTLLATIFADRPFSSFVGIPEKYHGLFFWWGVAGLWFSFRTAFTEASRRKAARIALVTLASTGVYALAQWLRADPLAWDTRVEITRVFSTMGNPNYYAGLLLPGAALALWAFEKRWSKIIVCAALVAILLMTKSLYGLALLAAWGVWEAVAWAKASRRVGIPAVIAVAAVAAVSGGWLAQSYGIVRHAPWACQNGVASTPVPYRACVGGDWQWVGDAEKWKGFLARFYIWGTVLDSVTESPKTLLLGRGPDSLKTVFDRFRRPELKGQYEDARYVADRAHNWILDMWHSFGLVGLLTILVPATLVARRLRGPQKTALVLWATFFLFNIPVSANWALAALVLAGASGGCQNAKIA